jgi:hypothetical protein
MLIKLKNAKLVLSAVVLLIKIICSALDGEQLCGYKSKQTVPTLVEAGKLLPIPTSS